MSRVPLIDEVKGKWEVGPLKAKRATFLMELAARGGTVDDAVRLTRLARRTVLKYRTQFQLQLA